MATQLEKQLKDLQSAKAKGVLTDEEYESRRAALISDTSTPVQAKQGGGIFKWGMMGCLGIFALLGILVVGLGVLFVTVSGPTTGSGPPEKAVDAGGDVRVPLAVGSSAQIAPQANGGKASTVTILQVIDNVESTNPLFRPAAGKKYYAIEVVIENTGSKEVTSLTWKLRDSNDVEVERSIISGSGVGSDLELVYSALTPGGKKQGYIVFEIDTAATAKWIRADPNPFLANDLYFDAP